MNLNFGTPLSRSEMKGVMGGYQKEAAGSCAYTNSDGEVTRGVSKAAAVAGASATAAMMPGDGHWCCDSCSSASWYNVN